MKEGAQEGGETGRLSQETGQSKVGRSDDCPCVSNLLLMFCSWWTFRIFFSSFLLGRRERGSPRRQRGAGGVRFFTENPRRARSLRREGGGRGGREGVCREFPGPGG